MTRAPTYAFEHVDVQVDTSSITAWALVGQGLELVGVPVPGRAVRDVRTAMARLAPGVLHAPQARALNLGSVPGGSRVVTTESKRYTERARELARATAVNAGRARLPEVHPDALVVATDASFDYACSRAGLAWIAADGRTGHAHRKVKAPHLAEIMAIMLALEANQHVPHLHLLSDAMGPLRAVGKALEGRKSDLDPYLQALLKRPGLTFEWVRGHDEHPLNEAADCLSRAARQPRRERAVHLAAAAPSVRTLQEAWSQALA